MNNDNKQPIHSVNLYFGKKMQICVDGYFQFREVYFHISC